VTQHLPKWKKMCRISGALYLIRTDDPFITNGAGGIQELTESWG
jgi:hypothetical protein